MHLSQDLLFFCLLNIASLFSVDIAALFLLDNSEV